MDNRNLYPFSSNSNDRRRIFEDIISGDKKPTFNHEDTLENNGYIV